MDKNKLVMLRRIGYHIPKTCGWCEHGQFTNGEAQYGVCKLRMYEHDKHTEPRHLTIHRAGVCANEFRPNEARVQILALSGFDQLVDRRAFGRNTRHKAKTHI